MAEDHAIEPADDSGELHVRDGKPCLAYMMIQVGPSPQLKRWLTLSAPHRVPSLWLRGMSSSPFPLHSLPSQAIANPPTIQNFVEVYGGRLSIEAEMIHVYLVYETDKRLEKVYRNVGVQVGFGAQLRSLWIIPDSAVS